MLSTKQSPTRKRSAGVSSQDAAASPIEKEVEAEFEPLETVAMPPLLSALIATAGRRRLTAARTWRGLAREELAVQAGISVPELGKLEAGSREATPAVAARLAAALNMPRDWIASSPKSPRRLALRSSGSAD